MQSRSASSSHHQPRPRSNPVLSTRPGPCVPSRAPRAGAPGGLWLACRRHFEFRVESHFEFRARRGWGPDDLEYLVVIQLHLADRAALNADPPVDLRVDPRRLAQALEW